MSGVKGRSGGARPGAGRKPKPKAPLSVPGGKDPLEFLLDVMNDGEADPQLRVKAAIAAARYVHPKKGEEGKKDERESRAREAITRRFAPSAPPKLVVSNG